MKQIQMNTLQVSIVGPMGLCDVCDASFSKSFEICVTKNTETQENLRKIYILPFRQTHQ